MTLVFGAFSGPSLTDVLASLKTEQVHIDGIELRLDGFGSIEMGELKEFIQNSSLPVMLTLRKKEQGGAFNGSEEERLEKLRSLCALNPHYLDLEWDVPESFRRAIFETFPAIQIVSSYHNFSETPSDLEQFRVPFAHILKIAVMAQSTTDALRMLSFVRKHSAHEKIIGVCMGKEGEITRILAPLVGGFATYASVACQEPTAPGQISAQQLQEIYHFRSLNLNTSIFALIGDPVEKSKSALFHNRVFGENGVAAVYVKIPLKTEELPFFFHWIPDFPVRGLSVTMPHKENVIPFLNARSPQVEVIGACNTIKIESGKMNGFNTDGIGALDAIEQRIKVRGKRFVVVGAGGAAQAIVYEAVQRGALVTILNRSEQKGIALAERMQCRGKGMEFFPEVAKEGYDVLVNCTPEGNGIEDAWILPGTVAMDVVYVPRMTPFLQRAEQKNCTLVFGEEMFINQAEAQQQIWFYIPK